MRLAITLAVAGVASNAFAAGDLKVLTRGPAIVLFVPATVWLLYIALEPHLRRIWPEVLIGWSRLLAGGVTDPLVGRDVLVGVLLGVGASLVMALRIPLQQQAGRPPGFPAGASGDPFLGMAATSDMLLGGRFAVSRIIASFVSFHVLFGTFFTFLALFVLYALLRRRWLAVAAMIALLTSVYARVHAGWLLVGFGTVDIAAPSPANLALFAALQATIVVAAVRFGLLTMIVASFVCVLLTIVPVLVAPPAPYAASSYLVGATVLVLAAYGCRTAIGDRGASAF